MNLLTHLHQRSGKDQGQATVELALVLPVLIVLMLMVVQCGVVLTDQVLLVHAARESARQAAVTPTQNRARAAALDGSHLDSSRLNLELSKSNASERVTTALSYRVMTMPMIKHLVPEIVVHAKATMYLEQ